MVINNLHALSVSDPTILTRGSREEHSLSNTTELAVINRADGESNGAETTRFATQDVQRKAILKVNATCYELIESSGVSLASSL